MRLAAYVTRTDREPLYRVTDRLHTGRTVQVPGREIARVVSAWLAELGAHSLVNDLERAARIGDWAAARAAGDQLSVHVALVAVAAAAAA